MKRASVDQKKANGVHYTPKILADFVAERILSNYQSTKDKMRIFDPAVGDGELLMSLMGQVKDSDISVEGGDIDSEAVEKAKVRLSGFGKKINFDMKVSDFLVGNSSLADSGNGFDIIISNPPYVRTQVLGQDVSQKLSKKFGLSGRVDLYHAFIVGIANALNEGGIAGIITPNRFMVTEGGKSLRSFILKNFDVLEVWDFGDTRLFKAAVLPSVIILKKKPLFTMIDDSVLFSKIYSCDSSSTSVKEAKNAIVGVQETGIHKIGDEFYKTESGTIAFDSNDLTKIWSLGSDENDEWLSIVAKNTYKTFGDIANIKVGVKTTADKTFISKDNWGLRQSENPELSLPLITHRIAGQYKSSSDTNYQIIYPYDTSQPNRKPLEIDDYPVTKSILARDKSVLENRKYLIDAGRKWYEIWVPHSPADWKKPKIVFRDISVKPMFWLDKSGAIVNGDCYWAAFDHESDLMWLALAVMNSPFIETFYDTRFNNKLYSGRRRYITQYVKHFPIPDPTTQTSKDIIKLAQEVYHDNGLLDDSQSKIANINELILEAFGLSRKSYQEEESESFCLPSYRQIFETA